MKWNKVEPDPVRGRNIFGPLMEQFPEGTDWYQLPGVEYDTLASVRSTVSRLRQEFKDFEFGSKELGESKYAICACRREPDSHQDEDDSEIQQNEKPVNRVQTGKTLPARR
jgi:hypothetical protein